MDSYTNLEKELKKDKNWIGIDTEPFIENVKKQDKKFVKTHSLKKLPNGVLKKRIKRCFIRGLNRPKIQNDSISMDDLLEKLYVMQKKHTNTNDLDFRVCICCPFLFTNKESFSTAVQARIVSDTTYLNIANRATILSSKLYNPQTIADGMHISKYISGNIDLNDAEKLITHINEIYETNICDMCMYLIFAFLMYEYTPLFYFNDMLSNANTVLNNTLLNEASYNLFKKTKDDRYLSILTLNAGIYSSWYKEFKLKFMGNIVQSRQPQREYFKSYTDNDPTTLNYSLLLPTLTDIEKAYIKVGKRFYRTEYDWLAPYIIYNKEKKELDIDTFHKFTMSTYASNADTIIVKTIHTAVFKYILSQTNKK